MSSSDWLGSCVLIEAFSLRGRKPRGFSRDFLAILLAFLSGCQTILLGLLMDSLKIPLACLVDCLRMPLVNFLRVPLVLENLLKICVPLPLRQDLKEPSVDRFAVLNQQSYSGSLNSCQRGVTVTRYYKQKGSNVKWRAPWLFDAIALEVS